MVRVFAYQADPAGCSPEAIAEEAFAICNGHPRDAGGEDLSRRYYQRELRSLSFPERHRVARGHVASAAVPCCRDGSGLATWVRSAGSWLGFTVKLVPESAGACLAGAGFAWLDDAGLVGQDDGLDPVAQAELGEQVAHV